MAIVSYDNPESAQQSVDLLHEQLHFGRPLYVQPAMNDSFSQMMSKMVGSSKLQSKANPAQQVYVSDIPKGST